MDAVVIQLNHITYAECGGKVMTVPCNDAEGCGACVDLLGDYWGEPVKDGGHFRGYKILKAAVKPTPDSIPLVRVFDKTTGNTLHVLGTEAAYRTACAGGAALPGRATVPIVVPEEGRCLDAGSLTNRTWYWTPPAKTGGQTYTVAAMYNNTQPTAPLTGAANVAAIVTYLNTNYAAAGTWSDVGGRIRLVRSGSDAKVGLTFLVV